MNVQEQFKEIGLEIITGNSRAMAMIELGGEISAIDGDGNSYVISYKNGKLSCVQVEGGQPASMIIRMAAEAALPKSS